MIEKDIEHALRALMKSKGWYTLKMHGGMFQSRLPDLYCMHRTYGTRWIELKMPSTGKLSHQQIKEFTLWWKYGTKVWILTGGTEKDYEKLFKPCNLQTYLELGE